MLKISPSVRYFKLNITGVKYKIHDVIPYITDHKSGDTIGTGIDRQKHLYLSKSDNILNILKLVNGDMNNLYVYETVISFESESLEIDQLFDEIKIYNENPMRYILSGCNRLIVKYDIDRFIYSMDMDDVTLEFNSLNSMPSSEFENITQSKIILLGSELTIFDGTVFTHYHETSGFGGKRVSLEKGLSKITFMKILDEVEILNSFIEESDNSIVPGMQKYFASKYLGKRVQ